MAEHVESKATIGELLHTFEAAAQNPRAQLDAALAAGKKAVGCLPPYCPEELAYAAGMAVFGLWGANGLELREAKRYFPAFLCSVVQTGLELALRGQLSGLSAVMAPALCDTLKCAGQNWKAAVPAVELIPVFHPQNRATEAGIAFMESQLEEVKARLEAVADVPITDEALARAIAVYNEHHAAMRAFSDIAAQYPQLISPLARSHVMKSAFFMDKAEHAALVRQLTAACEATPPQPWPGKKVVLTGITADFPSILNALAENNIAVAADEVAAESRQFRTDIPPDGPPLTRLARQHAARGGCSLLFDPQKTRAGLVVDLVKKHSADGVIVLQTKFCDPEEFDYPILKARFAQAGIPHLLLEVDRQTVNFEQAKTAIEAFADVI